MTEATYEVEGRQTYSLADKDDHNERAIRRYERQLARMMEQVVDSPSLEVALQFEKMVKAAIDGRIAELIDARLPREDRYSGAELAADTSISPQMVAYRAGRARTGIQKPGPRN